MLRGLLPALSLLGEAARAAAADEPLMYSIDQLEAAADALADAFVAGERTLSALPRSKPKKGKGHTFATRITSETYDALKIEGERTGRSMSQVAELWLEQARTGQAQLHDLLGGLEVASIMKEMAAAAHAAQDLFGPPSSSLAARAAITGAWKEITARVPAPAPTREEVKHVQAWRRARAAEHHLTFIKYGPRNLFHVSGAVFEAYRSAYGRGPEAELDGLSTLARLMRQVPVGTPFLRERAYEDGVMVREVYEPLTESEKRALVEFLTAWALEETSKDHVTKHRAGEESAGREFGEVYNWRRTFDAAPGKPDKISTEDLIIPAQVEALSGLRAVG
jgi:hypothetical protein